MAKHHGHHPWALAGLQARPARARPERRRRGALEICPRGPRRQVWPGLGSWLRPHRSFEPGFHSCQPPKVWIIDDFLQWSNLAYLAVSRVEYLSQLERVVCPPEEGSEGARTLTEQQLRKVIQRKLVVHKRQDQPKGLRFSLKVDHILALKEAQNNRCAACNIELLWAYQPKDTEQFSVDRFDNSAAHIRDNVRLACLECNRKRGAAALSA